MGYFPNGTSHEIWAQENCNKCFLGGRQCPIELAHLLYNYEQCKDEKSILHLLIPMTEDGLCNESCGCFIDRSWVKEPEEEK